MSISQTTRYIALLRGINVSGKNQITMNELKQELGKNFAHVTTLLNSGNVIFDSTQTDQTLIRQEIEQQIKTRFGLEIPVCVMTATALDEILKRAPAWWDTGDKTIYDNLIFVIPPTTCAQVQAALGEPNANLEKIQLDAQAIFWSFDLKNYRHTNWWSRTVQTEIRDQITIRTAHTMKKISRKCHDN